MTLAELLAWAREEARIQREDFAACHSLAELEQAKRRRSQRRRAVGLSRPKAIRALELAAFCERDGCTPEEAVARSAGK